MKGAGRPNLNVLDWTLPKEGSPAALKVHNGGKRTLDLNLWKRPKMTKQIGRGVGALERAGNTKVLSSLSSD